MDDAVEIEGLTRVFGSLVAVDRLTLTVRRPEILGLVGPDGAGKTTTLRMLAGILPPTSGRARVLGFALPGQAEKIKEHIGYMPQRFSLYADLTVEENLSFFAEIYRVPRRERAQRMDEAERCNRVAFLSRGRLLRIGTPAELKATYPHELLEVHARPLEEAAVRVREVPGVLDVQIFGEALHLVVEEARTTQEAVRTVLQRAGLNLLRLRPIAPTMEDVFMALLGTVER